jgi:cytochrome d ubiquinol oxidase subunit II
MPTERILGAVIVVALVLYVLLGGADFGGGVWDLLAFGPRRARQRALIERSLGPIWEANHVWLILVVVLLFSAFPPAFAAISISLHIPLTIFLIGVVLRGSAFTFRSYDSRADRRQKRWGLVFSLASVASPVVLGLVVGAIASGAIHFSNGVALSGLIEPWLARFPLVVGLFALSLFAFLAATYLANEADSPELADDFRARALASGAVVGLFALLAFALSWTDAPRIREGLTGRPFTWPLHGATALAASTAFLALFRRKFALARAAAAAQTTLILLGWAASQYPYLVVSDLTIDGAAANPRTQRLLLLALAAGSVLLFPSLYVLYRVFRGERAFRIIDRTGEKDE